MAASGVSLHFFAFLEEDRKREETFRKARADDRVWSNCTSEYCGIMDRFAAVLERDLGDTDFVNTKNAYKVSEKAVKKSFGSITKGKKIYAKLSAAIPKCYTNRMNFHLIQKITKLVNGLRAKRSFATEESASDEWGTPFREEVVGGKPVLRSAGEDEIFFNEDDEVYDQNGALVK